MSHITLITPTGARQETFARCEYYMERQTYKDPIHWIIIDDAAPPTPVSLDPKGNIEQQYVRGPVAWTPHINTQRPNMHEALQHVREDSEAIFIIEDDDYYAPEYLETLMWLLGRYEVVGEANNKYYAIQSRSYREWKNLTHASLCSTGMRYSIFQTLYDAVNSGELFMDMAFWRKTFERGHKNALIINLNIGVGMKQLPGRHGIGAGHDPELQQFIADPGFDMLKRWIPIEEDVEWYRDIARRPPQDNPGLIYDRSKIADRIGVTPATAPATANQNMVKSVVAEPTKPSGATSGPTLFARG